MTCPVAVMVQLVVFCNLSAAYISNVFEILMLFYLVMMILFDDDN